MPIEITPENPEQEPHREPHGQETPKSNGHDTGNGEDHAAGKLIPDHSVTIPFLKGMNPDRRLQINSISPDGGAPVSKIFLPGDWAGAETFINQRQALEWGVYFSGNTPKPGVNPNISKMDKTELDELLKISVDIDVASTVFGPDEKAIAKAIAEGKTKAGAIIFAEAKAEIVKAALEMLDDMFRSSRPKFINDSGNGVQIFFKLRMPPKATQENIDKAEAAARGLQDHFRKRLPKEIANVDTTQNADRIMRVPGTVNYPNKVKKEAGRVPCMSGVIRETDETVLLDDLLRDYPAPAGSASSSGSKTDNNAKIAKAMGWLNWSILGKIVTDEHGKTDEYDKLPEKLRKRFEEKRAADPALDALWLNGRKIVGKDTSGSGQVFELARMLARTGFKAMGFGMLARVWEFTPGGSGLDVNGGQRGLARAWVNANSASAKESFDDGEPEPSDEEKKAAAAAASASVGGRSDPRWKAWDKLLVELDAAREETKVNNADIETYGKNTPDFGIGKDEPFVTSRHARGEVSMLVAPPSRGKTMLVMTTAIAIILEKPELLTDEYRRDPTEVTDWAGDVVLVLNENAGRAQAMLAAAEAVHGFQRGELKHEVHIYQNQLVLAEMGLRGVVPTTAGLEFLRWLIEKRKKAEIALVVFDTFASATSGLPENSVEAMQPVMDMMAALAKAGYCAVEAIHHVAKSGSSIDAYQGRGSGATGGATGALSSLNRKNEDDKTRLVLSCLKVRNRADADDVDFKVVSHVRQVERARAPGNFRMASIAVLKRMDRVEVATEDSARDEQVLRDAAYALDIAVLGGVTIRPGGAKKSGTMKDSGGTWKAAWAVIYDAHNGVPGGRKSPMTANAAKALVARLEAKKVLKKVPSGEGDSFEMVPGWEKRLDPKWEEL